MQVIETAKLKELLQDSRRHAEVINVLPRQSFEQEHIKGSSNIPLGSDDFVQQVARRVQTKQDRVVVYCADAECDASPKAAEELEDNGFTNVYDYEDGMKGWREAGLPIATAA